MGCKHLGRRDDGKTCEGGILLLVGADPARRRTIDRLSDVDPVRRKNPVTQKDKHTVRVKPVCHPLNPLQTDSVLPSRQGRFIGQAYLGQDEPEGRGNMVAHVGDTAIKAGGRVQNHGHKIWRKFDVDIIEIQHVADGPGSCILNLLHRRLRQTCDLA